MSSAILKNLGFQEKGSNEYSHEELEHIIFLDEINEASDIVKYIYRQGILEGEHKTTKRYSSIISQMTGDILEKLINKKQLYENFEVIKDDKN